MIGTMGNGARRLSRGVSTVLALTVVALVSAVPAAAKTCYKDIVPPGQSGSSQYVEVIPTTCGSATPPSVGKGSSGGRGGPISHLGQGAAGVRALSHMGAQGQAAAALAAATAPAGVAHSSKTGGRGSSATGAAGSRSERPLGIPSVHGSSAGALGSALAGSHGSGLGSLLPILMGVLFGVAVAAGVARARHATHRSA
jgi:hypothetical protein